MYPSRRLSLSAGGAALALALAGCYTARWVDPDRATAPPPAEVAELFAGRGGVLALELSDPNETYRHDPGEKDPLHAKDPDLLRFRRAEIELQPAMPPGTVVADLRFFDGAGSVVELPGVDLLRLVPRLDTEGELQYPELLLEEYSRYSVVFRREHREFTLDVVDPRAGDAAERTYRAVLANNCLEPSKWELILASEDYSDFSERLRSPLNLNQSRTLAHSWFYLDPELYETLIRVKNPELVVDPSIAADYDALGRRAEEVKIDFDRLRRLAGREASELLEVGHRSDRRLEPLDREQHYKNDLGLFLNRDEYRTYADLPRGTVKLASYQERGFYDPAAPKEFDYGWLRRLDSVTVDSIASPRAGTYVELTLGGEGSPYLIRLGNVDLAHLDEQRLLTLPFGFNVYPLSRRHNPPQSTTFFDPDLAPRDVRPYLLMVDAESGRFVNNQLRGIDRVYLGWESIDRDVLMIFLISYERITPVWMACVKLDDELVDRARVRRALYG